MNLLIHSMSCFEDIYLPIISMCGVKNICEIGTEHGGNTRILQRYVEEKKGGLICIDPSPSQEAINNLVNDGFSRMLTERSLTAIPKVADIEAWFVDGDHNWFTVINELRLIEKNCERDRKPFLAFLHDVGWPCGRRDLYYCPDDIPEAARQSFDWELGVTLNNPDLIAGGYRGAGAFAWAIKEGGEHNGVQTAIEEFVASSETQYVNYTVPGVFGLGIMHSHNHPFSREIADLCTPYHQNSLLKRLEDNRLINYLRVLSFQDGLDGA